MELIAEPHLPDLGYEDEAQELLTMLRHANNYVELPSSIGETVFDGIKDTRIENQVSNYLSTFGDYQRIMANIGAYASLPLQLLGEVVKFSGTMTVTFPDGGTMQFEVSGVDSSKKIVWTYKKGIAKDGNGNKIPEKENEVNGHEYHFDTSGSDGRDTFNNFMEHLGSLGLDVSGASIGSGSARIIDCGDGKCQPTGDDGPI